MRIMKIIVGVDGSAESARALEWCVRYAPKLEAEVVAVFAMEIPVLAASSFVALPPTPPPAPDRDEVRKVVETEWCAPLGKAKVAFRVVVMDGPAAAAIISLAEREAADLVVAGRRGRGGFAELVLGSTTHHLSHHLDRPLVIVP
jgi:nucleotide-binding universal stress UspA family protein